MFTGAGEMAQLLKAMIMKLEDPFDFRTHVVEQRTDTYKISSAYHPCASVSILKTVCKGLIHVT